MTYKIFIGYEAAQDDAFQVLKYSLEKYSSVPLEVMKLDRNELEFFREDPLASTEFTYTRFLIPSLLNFKGIALFMDVDMLCFSDVGELFKLDMSSHALRCVKHDHKPTTSMKLIGKVQTQYPRKNWSSLMLLNCEKLTLWTRQNVMEKPASWLHQFKDIPDELIGEISPEWNQLDVYGDDTKLIHYTEGGPWLPPYKDHPYGDVWFKFLDEYKSSAFVAAKN